MRFGVPGGLQRKLSLQCICDMTTVKDGGAIVVTKELMGGRVIS